ncbi:Melanopsin-B [Trichoplax sp. H2]|nr:Melanopsin-B [Trichoplax sp. H2]|eukprot:RDD37695.1 Melanopsin-B [Trichoplax sp. H2]
MAHNLSNITYPLLISNSTGALVLMSIILIASLFCNALLILSKTNQQSKITPTDWLILNLAISDLGFMIIETIKVIFRYTTSSFQIFHSNSFSCRLLGGSSIAFNMTNVLTLTSLAIIQYYCVSRRPRSKWFILFRKVSFIIIITWVLPILTLAPSIGDVWGKFVYNGIIGSCSLFDDMRRVQPWHFTYNILLTILYFAVPICLVCHYYSKIFQIVRKARRRIIDQLSRSTNPLVNKTNAADIKIIIRLVIICLIFFICYVCVSTLIALSLSGILKINLFYEYILVIMLHADCVVIPIIFLSQDNFRAVRKRFRCL